MFYLFSGGGGLNFETPHRSGPRRTSSYELIRCHPDLSALPRAESAENWPIFSVKELAAVADRMLGRHPNLNRSGRHVDLLAPADFVRNFHDRPKTEAIMQQLLRLPQVMERTALSRSTIYELMAKNEFPRPLKISGARLNAWSAEEIDDYVRARAEQRIAS